MQLRGAPQDGSVPVSLGELGWWFYRSGDYPTATDLLGDAVQRRPGVLELEIRLAWSQIELQRNSDALQTLSAIYEQVGTKPEKTMARAMAEWQAQLPDQALQDFGAALAGQPEWSNPQWVTALYSSRVVTAVGQMQAERERRRKGQLARSR